MDFASSRKQTKDRNLARCAASPFTFGGAAKVALVDLNLSREPRLCLGELYCDQLLQFMEIKGSSMPIDASKLRVCARY